MVFGSPIKTAPITVGAIGGSSGFSDALSVILFHAIICKGFQCVHTPKHMLNGPDGDLKWIYIMRIGFMEHKPIWSSSQYAIVGFTADMPTVTKNS